MAIFNVKLPEDIFCSKRSCFGATAFVPWIVPWMVLQVMGGNLLVSLLAGFGDTFHVVYKVASWQHRLKPTFGATGRWKFHLWDVFFAAQPRSGLILLGPGLRLHFFLAALHKQSRKTVTIYVRSLRMREVCILSLSADDHMTDHES